MLILQSTNDASFHFFHFLTGPLNASTFSPPPSLKSCAVTKQTKQIMPIQQVCCDCIILAINMSITYFHENLFTLKCFPNSSGKPPLLPFACKWEMAVILIARSGHLEAKVRCWGKTKAPWLYILLGIFREAVWGTCPVQRLKCWSLEVGSGTVVGSVRAGVSSDGSGSQIVKKDNETEIRQKRWG